MHDGCFEVQKRRDNLTDWTHQSESEGAQTGDLSLVVCI